MSHQSTHGPAHEPPPERARSRAARAGGRRAAWRPMAMSDLQARRRAARRKRQIARFDVALGAVIALTLLLVSPGLAITAIVALVTLVACVVSLFVGRRRRLRAQEQAQERKLGTQPGPEPDQSRTARRRSGGNAAVSRDAGSS